MVQTDIDGTTLFFINAHGEKISADPISDWTRFAAFSQTESDQRKVPGVNLNRETNYNAAIGNYNATIRAGRTPSGPPPVKPMMEVVDDPTFDGRMWHAGVIHDDVPFDHALEDPLPLPKQAVVSGPLGPVETTVIPASNTDLLKLIVTQNGKALTLLGQIAATLNVKTT